MRSYSPRHSPGYTNERTSDDSGDLLRGVVPTEDVSGAKGVSGSTHSRWGNVHREPSWEVPVQPGKKLIIRNFLLVRLDQVRFKKNRSEIRKKEKGFMELTYTLRDFQSPYLYNCPRFKEKSSLNIRLFSSNKNRLSKHQMI